jgi:hypothetical protein
MRGEQGISDFVRSYLGGMMHAPRRTALYLLAILAMYGLAGTSDYAEQRKLECANRSTTAWEVSWDITTDTCTKEKRNGTTTQNR